jgi:hypothetical protein
VERISRSTLCRWFQDAALKPWTHHSWLFPRDPDFQEKAGRVLDLYHREWEGQPLGEGDYVLCADEKSQLQVLSRSSLGHKGGSEDLEKGNTEVERLTVPM